MVSEEAIDPTDLTWVKVKRLIDKDIENALGFLEIERDPLVAAEIRGRIRGMRELTALVVKTSTQELQKLDGHIY